MWPVLPETLTHCVVAPDGKVTTTTVTKDAWVGSPTVETADLGSGQQIVGLRANSVELRFATKLPVDLAYHDSTATTGAMELQGDSFLDTVSVTTDNGTTFDATYSNASSGDSIRIKVSAVSPADGPDYFKCELGAASSAISISTTNRTLGAWELPALRLKPLAEGNDERMLSVVPYLRGQANPTPVRPYTFGQFACVYPNLDSGSGGTMGRALGTTSAVFQPAGFQYQHVFDRDSSAGMLMVVADPEAHYKALYQHGDNVSHIAGVRHLPPNGRGRTTLGTGDAGGGYSVRIIPFRGGIAEGAHEYLRVTTEDLSPSWLPTRTQEDAQEATVAGWGYGQKRSGILASSYFFFISQLANYNSAAGGNRGAKAGGGDGATTTGSGEGLDEAETVSRVSLAMLKAIPQLGSNPDGVLLYGLSDEAPFEYRKQDRYTNFGETLVTAVASLTSYLAAYDLPHLWSGDSKWLAQNDGADSKYGWKTSLGDPDLVVMEDKSGAVVKTTVTDAVTDPVTGGAVSASFSEDWLTPNLGDANARAHIIDVLDRNLVSGDVGEGKHPTSSLDGLYLDALTGVFGGEDYRSGLTDDQKGISNYHSLGGVELARELRSDLRSKNDFGAFSEWPNEPLGLNLDGVSVSTNPITNAGVTQATLSVGAFNFAWSQYCPRFDFYTGFAPTVSTISGADNSIGESAMTGEYWRLIFQQAIAHGTVIGFNTEFANRVDLVPDDTADPEDPGYTAWTNWGERTLAFFKSVFTELRAVTAAPNIFAGKMLRDLDGTAQANLVDETLQVSGTAITGAEVHGRAWYVDNPRTAVYVILTTGESTAQSFTLKMDRGRYPDLPTGTLKVTEIGSTITTETVLTTFDHVLSLALTIPADGIRILKIERSG